MTLIETVVCYVRWAVGMGKKVIVEAVDFILSVIITAVDLALSLLPDAAVERPTVEDSVIAQMNYFAPIGPLAAQALILIAAWAIYRIYRYFIHLVAR